MKNGTLFYRWISKWCVPLEYLIDEYRIDISPSTHLSDGHCIVRCSCFTSSATLLDTVRIVVSLSGSAASAGKRSEGRPATGKNTFNSKRSLDFGLGIFIWNFYGMFIQKRETTGGFFSWFSPKVSYCARAEGTATNCDASSIGWSDSWSVEAVSCLGQS